MNNRNSDLIIEGLCKSKIREQILKTEGTTCDDISTPSGKIRTDTRIKRHNEVKCPKCNSMNVIIRDGEKFRCTECGEEWDIGTEEIKEGYGDLYENKKKNIENKYYGNVCKKYGFSEPKSGKKMSVNDGVVNITFTEKPLTYFISVLGGYQKNVDKIQKVCESLNRAEKMLNEIKNIIKERN